jgi:hypothetical protein
MEDVGICNSHLVYLEAIWHILRLFWYIFGNLVYFLRFGKLLQEKSGNPDSRSEAAAYSRSRGYVFKLPRAVF